MTHIDMRYIYLKYKTGIHIGTQILHLRPLQTNKKILFLQTRQVDNTTKQLDNRLIKFNID